VALTIFMLNLASDQAETAGQVKPGPLPADGDGAFLEPEKMAFAAVRHGNLWYAVHRNRITYDRRYDFGLMALKRRDANGRWRDIVRPRPNTRGHTQDSAGPVIEKGGVRYLPNGTSIVSQPGGVVLVRGGFISQKGVWLRRGVTFRFAPIKDGIAMTFPLRAGDRARMTTYLPDGQIRRLGATVFDSNSAASVTPAPVGFRFLDRGLGSCCDAHLVEAIASLRPSRDETYTYTVRAQAGPPKGAVRVVPERRHRRHHARGGTSRKVWLAVAFVLLAAGGLALAIGRRRSARRDRVGG
jgi:hypothetical protein